MLREALKSDFSLLYCDDPFYSRWRITSDEDACCWCMGPTVALQMSTLPERRAARFIWILTVTSAAPAGKAVQKIKV